MWEHGFYEKRRLGRMVSTAAGLYLLNLPEVQWIKSVEDVPAYQEMGVDFEVEMSDGRTILVEVKTDSYQSGAVFLETKCNGKDGCFVTSRADVWLYVQYKLDRGYWLPMDEVRPYVLANAPRYKVGAAKSKAGGSTWVAEGLIVPIPEVVENCPGARVYEDVLGGAIEVIQGVLTR